MLKMMLKTVFKTLLSLTVLWIAIWFLFTALGIGQPKTNEQHVASAKTNTFVNLEKGDIVLMNDGRACVVIHEPRWVVGSDHNDPETNVADLSCRPVYVEGSFKIRDLARLTRGVARPGDVNYETLAGDYTRQIIPKPQR